MVIFHSYVSLPEGIGTPSLPAMVPPWFPHVQPLAQPPYQADLDRLGSAAAQMLRLLRLSQEVP